MSDLPERRLPVRVLGDRWSPRAHEVRDFLARARVRYTWEDVARSPAARALAESAGGGARLPLVLFPDGTRLSAPSDEALAETLGMSTHADGRFYDLVIVGGGPAGLAAAVYGASEGLRTVIVEADAPGGQAGQSSSIENYLGFPEGLSGADLAARAVEQAERFGAEIVATRRAVRLEADGAYRCLHLDDGDSLECHGILLATGVEWRQLDAPGCGELVGAGVYYGAAAAEAESVRGRDVYLVGAGNSAGQAAMLLSRYARSVTLMAMEESFSEKMSDYLLRRIEDAPNVHQRPCCTVDRAEGSGRLEAITIRNVQTGETETTPAEALFVFIGAAPRTEWLEGTVARDERGFLLTGSSLPRDEAGRIAGWDADRRPFLLETSLPGVFAAGDARAGSVKRVASAVGEGAMAVQFVHEYLAGG